MRHLGQRLLVTLVFLIPKVVDFPFPSSTQDHMLGGEIGKIQPYFTFSK